MKLDHEEIEEQLEDYEGRLRGLNAFVAELKAKCTEHGTPKEHFEVDLTEAEHNIKFYECEIGRIKNLIEEEPDGAAYLVYKDDVGEWRWQLRAANHLIIADSGEGYHNKQDCLHAITLVKETKDAPVKERG